MEQDTTTPNVDHETWWPTWHVIQVQYRQPRDTTYVIGYIGHPFYAPCHEWYCKIYPQHEWCQSLSFDEAIRDLLRFHGLPILDGSTIPWPYHTRDNWIDVYYDQGDNGDTITREIIMKLRQPSLFDRWVLDGPIGRLLGALWTVKCMVCGLPRNDLDHE